MEEKKENITKLFIRQKNCLSFLVRIFTKIPILQQHHFSKCRGLKGITYVSRKGFYARILKKIKDALNIKMARKLVTKLSHRQCFTLIEKDTLKTASEKFEKHNVGVMPVLNEKDKSVIGIVSERDLARYIYHDEFKSDLPVNKIMTKSIISCNLNTSVTELMEIISSHKIRHIPIIEEKKLLGIVSIGDVVNHIIEQYKDENKQLRDFINQ